MLAAIEALNARDKLRVEASANRARQENPTPMFVEDELNDSPTNSPQNDEPRANINIQHGNDEHAAEFEDPFDISENDPWVMPQTVHTTIKALMTRT